MTGKETVQVIKTLRAIREARLADKFAYLDEPYTLALKRGVVGGSRC